ncbi:MAG: ABC transporter substrate-binding protein, partial [Pseudomonadota bacterium]
TRVENIQTLGPYKVERREIGQNIYLGRNLLYFGKIPKIEKAIGMVIEDEKTAIRLFQTNKIDIVRLIGKRGYQGLVSEEVIKRSEKNVVIIAGMNTQDDQLKNRHLRRAIAMAIDRSLFLKMYGESVAAANRYAPAFVTQDDTALALPFDLEKAKDELKLSGFDPSKPIAFDVTDVGESLTIVENIQSQLKTHLGLNIEINKVDLNLASSRIAEKKAAFFLRGLGSNEMSAQSFLNDYYRFDNQAHWDSPKYRRLLDQSFSLRGRAKKKKVAEAEAFLLGEAPVIPLFHDAVTMLVSPRVRNFTTSPLSVGRIAEMSL